MNEVLQRLKQRKLVQWTAAYVAAAFALLQDPHFQNLIADGEAAQAQTQTQP